MKPTITWILIANGARARILANQGPGKGVHEVDGMEFQQTPLKNSEIMADRPGRSFSSAGTARSAMEPQTDPVKKREADFVAEIAQMLDLKLSDNQFDRLIICAAPQALGNLREAMSPQLREKITHELPKDLTQIPNAKMGKHLEGILAV